jgi:putative acetyltransferase
MLSVKEETPRQPEVEEMIRQADAFAEALYPPETRYPFDIEALSQPKVRFFVARLSGKAVGCGALVIGKEGKAEIKRMFVSQTARGHGVGRLLLEEIEIVAREKDVTRIRLETGTSSHAALSLYRSCGYRVRGPFGAYQADPYTVFMEKKLAAG